MKQLFTLYRINRLLKSNHIQVTHYSPGRIRIMSPLWKHHETIATRITHWKKEEPSLIDVTHNKDTGSILIRYHAWARIEPERVETWLIRLIRES